MQVKNQWENAKLIMLNNKFHLKQNKSYSYYENNIIIISCYMCYEYVLDTVIVVVIDTEI
jgi:hypothetical protein